MIQLSSRLAFVLFLTLVSSLVDRREALAQIIPDNSLGAENSRTRSDTIKNTPSDVIEGGASRGSNLFHSFREFSIKEGRGAYFANPDAIQNIFTRVTGGKVSNILGTLGVLGNANLFLINPNGIIFGPNARLDMRGAFVGSTADSLLFDNNFEFSATNPDTPPLLTVNIPLGLRFREKAGDISNEGNLSVPESLTLKASNLNLSGSLVAGGDLTLEALNTVTVRDTALSPFIAASGGKLLLQGDRGIDIYALNHPQSGFFSGGDLVLRSANTVGADAHFWSGNSFRIEKLDGSLGGLVSLYDPVIRANGDVFLESYTGASLHILAGGSVFIPGTIQITGVDDTGDSLSKTITLSDGSTIVINGRLEPTVDIRAGTTAVGSSANVGILTSADINIGTIFFTNPVGNRLAGKVLLTNQYQSNTTLIGDIQVSTIRTGDFNRSGGRMAIDSKGELSVNGNISSSASPGGLGSSSNGNGGDIHLLAQSNINFAPNSSISSLGLLGGNITLKSQGNLALDGIRIQNENYSTVPDLNGGDINITAKSLTLTNGTVLSTRTFGRANSGDVNINVSDSFTLDGVRLQPTGNFSSTGILTNVGFGAKASAGNINITAGSLFLTNGAQIQSGVSPAITMPLLPAGQGNAGKISINVRDAVVLDGVNNERVSGIGSLLGEGATGSGGDIEIKARSLSLTNGGQLNTTTAGLGNAGNVNIEVQESVTLDGVNGKFNSSIQSAVARRGIGNSGDIRITASSLSLTNGGELRSDSFGEGNAGMVSLDIRGAITFDGVGNGGFSSGILSGVSSGKGGDVSISAGSLSLTNGAEISTSVDSTPGNSPTRLGKAGNIKINVLSAVTLDGESNTLNFLGQPSILVSSILSALGKGAKGSAGDIEIQAGSLSLTNGGQIFSDTFGEGNAGRIAVNIRGEITLAGVDSSGNLNSSFSTVVQPQSVGRGGDITIAGRSLSLTNNAQINASTSGQGEAGKITITADSLSSTDRASIQTNTFSSGQAGNITLNIKDNLTLTNSTIEASTSPNSTGDGGSIEIDPTTVTLTDDARISVNSQGEGDGGNIFLSAQNLTLNNGSEISATTASGEGGNITLNVPNTIRLRNHSPISSTADGTGNGGNIKINTEFLIRQENSEITANAFEGKGGNVSITANGLFADPDSEITASSQLGVEGVVETNTPEVDPSQGLVDLPTTVVDPNSLVSQNACRKGSRSEFIVSGRGGLPSSPDQVQGSNETEVGLVDLAENSANTVTSSAKPIASREIVPAQGWIRNDRGEVVLVGDRPDSIDDRRRINSPASCQ